MGTTSLSESLRKKKPTLIMKRLFDITVSLIGLLATSPLFIIVGILVTLTSPGGPFFLQVRTGKNGRPFRIIKFRSMAKNSSGSLITVKNDSRVTPVGRVLRKTKIDELPQLINVFMGQMSFVGPRPEVPAYTELYSEEQRQIFLVRPGITDPASIVFRNENDLLLNASDVRKMYVEEIMPQKIAMGLEYIRTLSFIGDLKIIFKTLFVLFR